MDWNTIIVISAIAGGLYLLLTFLEKLLIKKKTKQAEVTKNDNGTSNPTDTTSADE